MNIMNRLRRLTNGQLKAAAAVMVALAIIVPTLSVAASTDNANNILWNGCGSLSSCQYDMEHGDGHNSASNITAIYNYFGINSSNITSMVPVNVYSNGNVTISENDGTWKSGNTIATGAESVGRQDIDGSSSHYISGIGVWERSTSVSFVSSPLSGWALMQNGQFKAFILSSCGNAGTASPKTPPAAPAKQPQPQQPQPQQNCGCEQPQQPVQPEQPAQPEGFVTCVALTPSNNGNDTYNFMIQSQVSGNAEITGYQFTTIENGGQPMQWSPQSSPTLTNQSVPSGTSLTVEGQVLSSAGDTNITNTCSATVSTPAEETAVVTPATPTPTPAPAPAPLPQTGPESALGGAAGLTGIGVAGRAYLRSRKSLLASLRNIKR